MFRVIGSDWPVALSTEYRWNSCKCHCIWVLHRFFKSLLHLHNYKGNVGRKTGYKKIGTKALNTLSILLSFCAFVTALFLYIWWKISLSRVCNGRGLMKKVPQYKRAASRHRHKASGTSACYSSQHLFGLSPILRIVGEWGVCYISKLYNFSIRCNFLWLKQWDTFSN